MENFKEKIYQACKNGEIDTVSNYFKYKDTLYVDNCVENRLMAVNAIAGGQLEILNIILDISSTTKNFFNDENINLLTKESCDQNNIKILAYLLEYPFIVKNQYPHFIMKIGMYCAANGKLEPFKYICENFLDDYYFNMSFADGNVTALSAQYGHTNVLEYMFTNENLIKLSNVSVIEKSFKRAIENKNLATLHYFVFDKNLEITPFIQEFIKKDTFIANIFETRSLKQSLTNDLDYTQNNNIIKKTKI